jgi:RNA polymerase sigma-70 factor (sigma-E family)
MTVRPRSSGPIEHHGGDKVSKPTSQTIRGIEPFDRFYAREFRSVVGLAYALSGSRSASEDLAQEAFIAAHGNWDKIGAYEKPEAWVRRVVSNLAVSRFRRRTAEMKALTRLGGFRTETTVLSELPSEAEEFWPNVRRLPKRQAQVIALHYLEDLPVADIAEILQCSPNTVKVHLHKGRRRLADRLGVETGGET